LTLAVLVSGEQKSRKDFCLRLLQRWPKPAQFTA